MRTSTIGAEGIGRRVCLHGLTLGLLAALALVSFQHSRVMAATLPLPVGQGGAIQIAAANQRVEIPNANGAFNSLSAITVEAWVNITFPRSRSDWTPMLGKGADWGLFVRVVQQGGQNLVQQIGFNTGNSSAGELIHTGNLGDAWHHVAAIYDGAKKQLYWDGVLVAENNFSGFSSSSAGPVVLGNGARGEFVGTVDAVRIWSKARSRVELVADIDRHLLPWQAGLMGEWRFDEPQGTSALDSSGNGRTATLIGASRAEGLVFRPMPLASALTTLSPGEGDVRVSVNVVEAPGGRLRVILQCVGGNVGDLQGFWANLRDDSLARGLSVTGNGATSSQFLANGVSSSQPGANINGLGLGPFDLFVGIGTPGVSPDDFQSVEFVLAHTTVALTPALFDGQLMAARLTSVGPPGSRTGSAKISGVARQTGGLRFATGQFGEVQSVPAPNCGTDTSFNFSATDAFTLEAWVKLDAIDAPLQPIISKGNAWGLHAQRVGSGQSARLLFRTTPGSEAQDFVGSTELLTGRWYHVAAVYSNSRKFLYVDAVTENAPGAAGFPGTSGLPVRVGGNAETQDASFNGALDTVRVWKRARTAAELAAHQLTEFRGWEPDLVSEWRFEESAGTDAHDLSLGDEHRHHLVLMGSDSFMRTAGVPAQALRPIADGGLRAIRFAAGSPALAHGLSAADAGLWTDLKTLTLGAWVKIDSLASGVSQVLVSKGNGWGILLEPEPGSSPTRARAVFYTYDGKALHQLKSVSYLGVGAWHHIAAVLQNETKQLFVDGLPDSGVVAGTGKATLGENTLPIRIGSATGVASPVSGIGPFQGTADEVQIWLSARSKSQIQDGLDHQLHGTEDGLFAAWTFDQAQNPGADMSLGMRHLDGAVEAAAVVDGLPVLPPADGELALAISNPAGGPAVNYAQVANDPDLNPATALTMEAWVRVDTLPTGAGQVSLISKGSWSLRVNSAGRVIFTTLDVTSAGAPAPEFLSSRVVERGTWVHVAASYGAAPSGESMEKRIYLDGLLDQAETGFAGSLLAGTEPLLFGAEPGATPGHAFDGRIDEVRVWEVQRTAAQVQETFQRCLNGNEPGLVSVWTFSEGGGTVIRGTPRVPDGTLIGMIPRAPGFVPGTPLPPQYSISFLGGECVSVSTPHDTCLALGPAMTLEAWVRPEAPVGTDWNPILSKGTTGYGLALDENGQVRFYVDGSPQNALSSLSPVVEKVWQHVAVVVDVQMGTTTFYLNGVKSGSFNSAIIANNTDPLFIGKRGSLCFKGEVDEVRIWNRARTELEVKSTSASEVPLPAAGLCGYWKFDQGQGTIVPNSASTSLTLTIVTSTPTPIFADGSPVTPPPSAGSASVEPEPSTQGLWIGEVSISEVNEVQKAINGRSTRTTPTASPASFTIILHVNASGEVTLLKDVIVMKRRGAPTVESEMVLITDPALIPQFDGVVPKRGRMVGIRYGTVGYDFDGFDKPLTGGLGTGRGCLGEMALSGAHPTNPYRHKFHPDHGTGFDITRQFSLEFVGSNNGTLRGRYREKITGLHKIPLEMTGTIAITKVSNVPALNGGS